MMNLASLSSSEPSYNTSSSLGPPSNPPTNQSPLGVDQSPCNPHAGRQSESRGATKATQTPDYSPNVSRLSSFPTVSPPAARSAFTPSPARKYGKAVVRSDLSSPPPSSPPQMMSPSTSMASPLGFGRPKHAGHLRNSSYSTAISAQPFQQWI